MIRCEGAPGGPDRGGGPAVAKAAPGAAPPPLRATVLERFPATDYGDFPLTPMLSTLPKFCFLDGVQVSARAKRGMARKGERSPSMQEPRHLNKALVVPFLRSPKVETEKPRSRSPAFHAFALTVASGARLYTACLMVHERRHVRGRLFYIPKAICIFSQVPCLGTMRQALRDLVIAARGDGERQQGLGGGSGGAHLAPRLARSIIAQLFFELPLPPDRTTQVVFTTGSVNMSLLDQTFTRDFSFRPLLACLSVEHIVKLLLLVLLERKVVLATKKLSAAFLCATCETLRALLFPLEWVHTYIPVLPPSMSEVLECPSPFIIGVVGSGFEVPEDVTVFDLDQNTMSPDEHLPSPSAVVLPLQRLRHAFPWEQGQANRQYWTKYHLEPTIP